MPTAAKLVSGVFFALTAYIAAEAFKLTLSEFRGTRGFSEMNGALGFLVGWLVMGPGVGAGWMSAIGKGVTVSVYILLWSDIMFSVGLVLRRSAKTAYKSVDTAITAVFENLLDFMLAAMIPSVLIPLLVGGAVAGILAEAAHRKWR